jgi:hypothetical protein
LDGSYIAAVTSHRGTYLFSRELVVNNPPSLSSGTVSPTSGYTGAAFTYEVVYTDNDWSYIAPHYGTPPSYVKVYIDNVAHNMWKVSGTYTVGALYRYTTSSLSAGAHVYHFEASDGIDMATSDSYSGPNISFKVTLTFRRPDGSPLANTEVYYGFSSDNVVVLLGKTDSQGKITTHEDLGGRTIYFRASDAQGQYSGSKSISSTGGEETVNLSGSMFFGPPLLLVIIIVLVLFGWGTLGVILVKRRKRK